MGLSFHVFVIGNRGQLAKHILGLHFYRLKFQLTPCIRLHFDFGWQDGTTYDGSCTEVHVNETSRDLWYIQTVTDVGPAGECGTRGSISL